MKNITILGAGRSATVLIDYALETARIHNWSVTVADADLALANQKAGNHPNCRPVFLDAQSPQERQEVIRKSDIVISLLPPHLHILVAHDCLHLGRHLVNASYLSKELQDLDQAARGKGLTFMGEMGLDPGIDHMSAMQKIHEIREKGGKLLAFRSFTGGLVAPESDDNPWHYKFTWNPRNVILAGQGTARYLEDNQVKYLPYNRLFKRLWPIDAGGPGAYEAYANRDSLPYRELYGLPDIPTLLRGTIRVKGFCDAWDVLAQLGLTDPHFFMEVPHGWTYGDWLESYLPAGEKGSLPERIARLLGIQPDSGPIQKMEWLGLFGDDPVPALAHASPALILEDLLLKKWKLQPADKDMIIMQHQFEYEWEGKRRKLTSTLSMKGENEQHTAMAKLVGLPLGIFSKLLLEEKVQVPGVHLPVMKEVYEPVLDELARFGVVFHDIEEKV